VPLLHFGWSDLRVVREGRWKYIQAPRPELYDLDADPEERQDLSAAQPARVQAMRAGLARILQQERAARTGGGAASDELLEKLGALGYVGAGGPAETATPGADPKDKVQEFRAVNSLIREGLLALQAGDAATAARTLREVLGRGISSFEVHYHLARALQALGRPREAGPHFDEAARRVPAHAAAWEGAAECRLAARDVQGALERLRRGQAASPTDPRLYAREGHVLRVQGRRPDARRAYEAAVSRAPGNARLRVQLGELLREMGQPDEAIRHLQAAVEAEPSQAAYWNTLGMTLGGSQRMAEAEKAFREAWRLDDRNHHHAYNLGLILLRQGRAGEARDYFEKALALEPRFAPARQRLAEAGRRGAGGR
jgi:tetratricopeptide (TPR) repeat protein